MAKMRYGLLLLSDIAVNPADIAGVQAGHGEFTGMTFIYLRKGQSLRTVEPVEDVLDALEGVADDEEEVEE